MESEDATLAECRICQEEDNKGNMENPCACSGSLKYAHKKCLQRWSLQKGDSICELCYQQYTRRVMPRRDPNIQAGKQHKPSMVDQKPRGDMDIQGRQISSAKMLEWREREHEMNDSVALQDADTIHALRECGLLKFFMVQNMRAQVPLLEKLIDMWDVDGQFFLVGGNVLTIEVEDLYFLTGLSRRGASISLAGSSGDAKSTDEYIALHCRRGTKKSGNKIPIKDVTSLPLQTILFTITRVAGSLGPHLASKSQMKYALECLGPTIFNWCQGLLVNLKDQVTKCKTGRNKQFGYGSILVSFFLERVPLMRPQVPYPKPTKPRMKRWTDLSARLGGGPHVFAFGVGFFHWWADQIIMVDNYPYAGMDFRGDNDLALPEGEMWGNIDIGPVRHPGMSPLHRQAGNEGEAKEDTSESARRLREVQSNLEGLTMGVSPMRMDDIPLHLQRHTVGVPSRFSVLLRQVARAIISYHEHRAPQDD